MFQIHASFGWFNSSVNQFKLSKKMEVMVMRNCFLALVLAVVVVCGILGSASVGLAATVVKSIDDLGDDFTKPQSQPVADGDYLVASVTECVTKDETGTKNEYELAYNGGWFKVVYYDGNVQTVYKWKLGDKSFILGKNIPASLYFEPKGAAIIQKLIPETANGTMVLEKVLTNKNTGLISLVTAQITQETTVGGFVRFIQMMNDKNELVTYGFGQTVPPASEATLYLASDVNESWTILNDQPVDTLAEFDPYCTLASDEKSEWYQVTLNADGVVVVGNQMAAYQREKGSSDSFTETKIISDTDKNEVYVAPVANITISGDIAADYDVLVRKSIPNSVKSHRAEDGILEITCQINQQSATFSTVANGGSVSKIYGDGLEIIADHKSNRINNTGDSLEVTENSDGTITLTSTYVPWNVTFYARSVKGYGSGSGGCNAGLGFVGLALVFLRKRLFDKRS